MKNKCKLLKRFFRRFFHLCPTYRTPRLSVHAEYGLSTSPRTRRGLEAYFSVSEKSELSLSVFLSLTICLTDKINCHTPSRSINTPKQIFNTSEDVFLVSSAPQNTKRAGGSYHPQGTTGLYQLVFEMQSERYARHGQKADKVDCLNCLLFYIEKIEQRD